MYVSCGQAAKTKLFAVKSHIRGCVSALFFAIAYEKSGVDALLVVKYVEKINFIAETLVF